MKVTLAITYLATSVLLATGAESKEITYNVVSLLPSNETIGVIVDNQVYQMNTKNSTSAMLFTGKAPAASTGYKYAVLVNDGTKSVINQENFTRSPVSEDSTLNEYFGRSWNNFSSLPQLPAILSPLPIMKRKPSKLHMDGQIPAVHFTGNQTAIDYAHAHQKYEVDVTGLNMTYISPDYIKTFTNLTFSVSGHSTRSLAKTSYKFKMPKNQDLFGYRRFKLRSMATDASYMREEIVYSIAKSVGLPTTEYSYVRMFINDKAVGLFGIAEQFKNPWIENEFNNGTKMKQGAFWVADHTGDKPKNGSVFSLNDTGLEGSLQHSNGVASIPTTHSDLSYLGNNVSHYSAGQYSLKEEPSTGEANYTRIMELTKFISEQSNTTISHNATLWEEHMDVTSFLRGIAFEIAVSNSDSYLAMTNNYILYDDLKHERIVFSTQDLDLTLGRTMFNTTLMFGGNYTEYPGFTTRPLMTRLLAVPEYKQAFENLLVNITKGIMNIHVLEPRIDGLAVMLAEDVAWDKSLPRLGTLSLPEYAGYNNTYDGGPASMLLNTTFSDAVNGTSGNSNDTRNLSLKGFITLRSTNLMNFFNQTI